MSEIASAGSFSAVDRAQAAGTASLSYWQRAYRHVRRDRVTLFACTLLLLITLLSLAAPMFGHLLNKDPATQDLLSRLEKPTHAHWLGTDELGRDILIRLLYAGRISLLIGVLAMLTSLVIGVSLGVLGGFFRRWVDDAINGIIQT